MLHSDFYVDDLLSASQTLAQVIQFQKDVSSILQQAGYSQRKWASNNLELLATIPENLQETKCTSTGQKRECQHTRSSVESHIRSISSEVSNYLYCRSTYYH